MQELKTQFLMYLPGKYRAAFLCTSPSCSIHSNCIYSFLMRTHPDIAESAVLCLFYQQTQSHLACPIHLHRRQTNNVANLASIKSSSHIARVLKQLSCQQEAQGSVCVWGGGGGGGHASKAARAVLPAQSVTLQVSIQQAVPVVLQAPLPRQQQVLHQEAGTDDSTPVVQPACGPQLAHGCVHHGVPCVALSPSLSRHHASDLHQR